MLPVHQLIISALHLKDNIRLKPLKRLKKTCELKAMSKSKTRGTAWGVRGGSITHQKL